DKIELFPNQFVNVRLRVSTLDAAVVLPTAAVQHGSAGTFIYVVQTTPVQPGKAEAAKAKSDEIQTDKVEADKGEAGGAPKPRVTVRKVDLGPSSGMLTAVTRGLQAGEQVVIEGLDGLRENAEVIIVEDDPATRDQAAPATLGSGT